MGADPLLGQMQVASNRDRIAIPELSKGFARLLSFAIEECLDEGGNVLGTKRPHGNSKMQAVIKVSIRPLMHGLQSHSSRIFAISKP